MPASWVAAIALVYGSHAFNVWVGAAEVDYQEEAENFATPPKEEHTWAHFSSI